MHDAHCACLQCNMCVVMVVIAQQHCVFNKPRCIQRTQHDASIICSLQANGLGRHNFVRCLALEHAILMDARFVCKGIGTHNGLDVSNM